MRNIITVALAVASLLAALPAAANELDAAKAAGHVGEQADGFLGVVPGAPSSAQGLVVRINEERALRYGEIAAKNKTSPSAVAALAGKKLIGRTPPGQWIRDADGKWTKK
jgi:uncharacterized protein YdbL (DUF1318 family)